LHFYFTVQTWSSGDDHFAVVSDIQPAPALGNSSYLVELSVVEPQGFVVWTALLWAGKHLVNVLF